MLDLPDVSFEPVTGDPFTTQPMPQPGERVHGIMPEQEEVLAGSEPTGLIPMLGGGGWRAQGAPPPMGHNEPPPEAQFAPGEVDRISTAIPKSKLLTYDPHANPRPSDSVGMELSQASPAAWQKNANLITEQYTGHQIPPGLSADETHEMFINHLKDNLVALHNTTTDEERAAAKQWYDGGNKIVGQWADEFGLEPRQVAGVIAAQSPQKDWDQNLSLARRVLDITRDQASGTITPEMRDWAINYVKDKPDTDEAKVAMMSFLGKYDNGSTLSQITDPVDRAHFIRAYDEAHNDRGYDMYHPTGVPIGPALNLDNTASNVGWGSMRDIAKAVSVLQDGSVANISRSMGDAHKVRSFYNNLISPNSRLGDTTIDTHAIAAANIFPLTGKDDMVAQGLGQKGSGSDLTGSRGLYGDYHEAYSRAADELGYDYPRQLQSVVWEKIRNLFPAEYKTHDWYRDPIRAIWQEFHDGRATLQDTHARLFDTIDRLNALGRAGRIGAADAGGPSAAQAAGAQPAANPQGVSEP